MTNIYIMHISALFFVEFFPITILDNENDIPYVFFNLTVRV
jgi:hypothetical protein